MNAEPGGHLWQNMSAPPRSTVTLPRISAPADASNDGEPAAPLAAGQILVGPGGGKRLSNAVCVCHLHLAHALCAWLGIAVRHELFARRLGAARLWLALLRSVPNVVPPAALALGESLGSLPDGELLEELAKRVSGIDLPAWVPGFAVAQALGADLAEAIVDAVPSIEPANAVRDPRVAARLATAIHGPLVLRTRMPSIEHLLEIPGRSTPSLSWILWKPTPVGRLFQPTGRRKEDR